MLADTQPAAQPTQPSLQLAQLATEQTQPARRSAEAAAEQKKMRSGRQTTQPTRLVRALGMLPTGLLMVLGGPVRKQRTLGSMWAEQQPRLKTI